MNDDLKKRQADMKLPKAIWLQNWRDHALGANMKRLEVLDLYELGAAVSHAARVLRLEKPKPIDVFFALVEAEGALNKFKNEQTAFGLAVDNADAALNAIQYFVVSHFYETSERAEFKKGIFEQELPTWQFHDIKAKLEEFVHVFSAVCRKCETYFIEQKLGFDISFLLHRADENIHVSVRSIIAPPALDEIKAAGRCFALENYTACGFHTLRALEVVMGDYYKQVSGKNKEFRSWYDLIQAFQKLERSRTKRGSKYPSPKVSAMLDRMRELDRNPLMHPRDSLDEMAADTLFKLGIVTITELAKDMRDMAEQPELMLIESDARIA